ncbi:MAG: carboxymuconolactone decarboxylase family protein [Planctomycetota bacterium]|jgi:AhpD family alkylhydroperoxidase
MALDDRIKELIAIGASVTANCQPCLEYHVRAALESGVDQQEIEEAVVVGRTVRRGAAAKFDEHAASLCGAAPPGPTAPDEGEGCGV